MSEAPIAPSNLPIAVAQSQIAMATVVKLLVEGKSVKEAGLVVGVRPATIHAWKRENQFFNDLLITCTDDIVNKLIESGQQNHLNRVKELGDRAVQVLADALNSDDEKTRISAANSVLRYGAPARDVNVHVGIESFIGRSSIDAPALGD